MKMIPSQIKSKVSFKKNQKFRFFIFATIVMTLTFLLNSCSHSDDGKGSLVVQNRCENPNMEISAVYVMEQGSSGYNLVYTGSIKSDKSYFIELKEGKYSVKIAVSTTVLDVLPVVKYYETGYNIYKKLGKDEFVNVVFDGYGIYFD